jgi:hypothetical protein
MVFIEPLDSMVKNIGYPRSGRSLMTKHSGNLLPVKAGFLIVL